MAERLVDAAGAPPPVTWWLAAALALLIVAGLWFWTADARFATGARHAAQACAASLPARAAVVPDVRDAPRAPPLIVAVGDSLLNHATYPVAEFRAALPGVHWHTCPIPSGSWRELAQVLPLIEARRPDVLVIQESQLRDTQADPAARVPAFFAQVSRKIRTPRGEPLPILVLDPVGCATGKPGPAEDYVKIIGQDPATRADVADRLRRLERAGVRVVILDIPRHAALESGFEAVLARWRADLTRLAAETGATYWSFAPVPGADAYCGDQAHLAAAGRDRFAPQLAARLQQALVDLRR